MESLVTLKDIHNLRTRMKQKSHRGLQDAELLLEELETTVKNDPSASAGLVVNEKIHWKFFSISQDT